MEDIRINMGLSKSKQNTVTLEMLLQVTSRRQTEWQQRPEQNLAVMKARLVRWQTGEHKLPDTVKMLLA